MANKSSGGAVLIGLIILAILLQYWKVFLPIGLLVLIIWIIASKNKEDTKKPPQQRSVSSSPPSKTNQYENNAIGITVTTSYQGSSSRSNQNKSVPPDSVWVPPGGTIEHAGYTITGGLIYFGKNLKSIQRWGNEPALIDPGLPVNRANPDREGQNMDYWPSYSEISPSSRAAYLEWLSGGRKNPSADIGYVFLYFYGLERRALADAGELASARGEIPVIIEEVKRLLSIYGRHSSFRRYACSLMHCRFRERLNRSTTPRLGSNYNTTGYPQLSKLLLGRWPLLLSLCL